MSGLATVVADDCRLVLDAPFVLLLDPPLGALDHA